MSLTTSMNRVVAGRRLGDILAAGISATGRLSFTGQPQWEYRPGRKAYSAAVHETMEMLGLQKTVDRDMECWTFQYPEGSRDDWLAWREAVIVAKYGDDEKNFKWKMTGG
jgi:hypothetical protein